MPKKGMSRPQVQPKGDNNKKTKDAKRVPEIGK